MATTISVEIFGLLIAYLFTYMVIYIKVDRTLGYFAFSALGATSYLMTNVHPSTSLLLTILPIIGLVGSYLMKPSKKRNV